jgi:hypothetical protein
MEVIMPALQLNDVPLDLYEALSFVAKKEKRSVPQQTITFLRSAINIREERVARRRAVFQKIDELHIKNADMLTAPAELIREDRER